MIQRRYVAIALVVLVGLFAGATLLWTYHGHRETERQAAIERQLKGLSTPARRSTPISLRPDGK